MTNLQKPFNYSRLMTGSCNCPVGLPLPKVPKKNLSFCGFGVRTPSPKNHSKTPGRWITTLPEERASYAEPGLAWHWGGTFTSQCMRADVAQHALDMLVESHDPCHGTPSLNIVVQLWTKWSQQFRMHERLKKMEMRCNHSNWVL